MRNCPACGSDLRTKRWSMGFKIPDGWPLPTFIEWRTCDACGMLYGDGDFDQCTLDAYYQGYYGYGVNSPQNVARLAEDAARIARVFPTSRHIVDFGGGEHSVIRTSLQDSGYHVTPIGAGDDLPDCDVIYASHVIEHIYDLDVVMRAFGDALSEGGTLIIDGPDSTGIVDKWKMPMLDYNTKHINHFRLQDYLRLASRYGYELFDLQHYELHGAPAYQLWLKRGLYTAHASAEHIAANIGGRLADLRRVVGTKPVNVWGLGDITWHILTQIKLNVLDYIDNDPAYRGATYDGKVVQERPTNDAPIVILAQGQRARLIANIRGMGVTNPIIEI